MDGGSVEIYYMKDVPRGLRWAWYGTELLVIEAHLDDTGRQEAIDAAFADARTRALGGGLGRQFAA